MTYRAEDFITAIRGSGGIITTICRRMGCSYNTAAKYISKHPKVREAYEQECESILDMAEGVLIKNIQNAAKLADTEAIVDTSDVKWYLSRKGKQRGYFERADVNNTNFDYDLSRLTDEQLLRIVDGEDPRTVVASSGKGAP